MLLFHNHLKDLFDDESKFGYNWAKPYVTLMAGHKKVANYTKLYGKKYEVPSDFLAAFESAQYFTPTGDVGKEIQTFQMYIYYLYTKLKGLKEIVNDTLEIAGATSRNNEILTNSITKGPDIWGPAVLRWLVSNRASRSLLNDVTFLMLASREAGYADRNSKSFGGLATLWSSSNAYGADRAIVKGKDVGGVAVSYGGRQQPWWLNTAKLENLPVKLTAPNSTELGTLTRESLATAYPLLGCIPWWAQALIFAEEINLRGASDKRFSYLAVTSAKIDPDPTFRSCFYPYVLMEQPALNNKRVKDMMSWGPIKNSATCLKNAGIKQKYSDILINGITGGESSVLFNARTLSDSSWLDLISGVSGMDLSLDMVDTTKKTTPAKGAVNSFGFVYGSNARSKASVLREYVYSGVKPKISEKDSLTPMTAAFVVPLQRKITLI